jgi:hypothetical protein
VTYGSTNQQFADGLAYSKGKMEEAFRPGGLLEKPYKAVKDSTSVKREDIDLIVRHTIIMHDGILDSCTLL